MASDSAAADGRSRWQSTEKRHQVIREYDTGDLAELLEVWYAAAQIAHPFWTRDLFEEERRDISQKFLPIAETWVVEREGRVVGFI